MDGILGCLLVKKRTVAGQQGRTLRKRRIVPNHVTRSAECAAGSRLAALCFAAAVIRLGRLDALSTLDVKILLYLALRDGLVE